MHTIITVLLPRYCALCIVADPPTAQWHPVKCEHMLKPDCTTFYWYLGTKKHMYAEGLCVHLPAGYRILFDFVHTLVHAFAPRYEFAVHLGAFSSIVLCLTYLAWKLVLSQVLYLAYSICVRLFWLCVYASEALARRLHPIASRAFTIPWYTFTMFTLRLASCDSHV